jgi:Caspase domain/Effector-associated domain 2
MSNSPQPQSTYALVVGIETYSPDMQLSGLNGPANDACTFTCWLLQRGVPATNIFLHLSPLQQRNMLNTQAEISVKAATRTEIRSTITDILPQKQGDLLYFFWGGHGVLTLQDNYRLYYADASMTDKKNLDVASLLRLLRSDDITSFQQQIFMFDACANYQEDARLALPDDTFTPHILQAPVIPHEQFVIFAAGPGEFARNNTEEQTGIFSKVVLQELTMEPENRWPPDMEQVTTRVVEEFILLRQENLAQQTPTYFCYQDWIGNKRLFGQLDIRRLGKQAPQSRFRKYSFDQVFSLVEKLLECPHIQDLESRNEIIDSLRPQIARSIKHHSDDKIHVTRMVRTCLNYTGGIQELIHILESYEGEDSHSMIEVNKFLKSFPPDN